VDYVENGGRIAQGAVRFKVGRATIYGHYSQVKLKTLLSLSNFTHFLPIDPIKV